MPLQDHIYPQDSDADDAENFAQLNGDPRLSGYVITGLKPTNLDYANGTFDLTEGVAKVYISSAPAATSGEDRKGLSYIVQVSARTGLSMGGTGERYVWLDPDLQNDDAPIIQVGDSGTTPESEWLRIATIDRANDSFDRENQFPDALPLLVAPVVQRYDGGDDVYAIRDQTNSADRLHLDRTTGDLKIAGELTENASL